MVPGFSHPTFKAGVEVVHWNGMPIERAVLNHSQRFAGSNREARHARGVQTLTQRALILALPPDEDWVIVGYRTSDGQLRELRVDWAVNAPPGSGGGNGDGLGAREIAALGVDLEQEVIQRTRKALFAPKVIAAEQKAAQKMRARDVFGALESTMPGVFEAKPVTTPSGTFGTCASARSARRSTTSSTSSSD